MPTDRLGFTVIQRNLVILIFSNSANLDTFMKLLRLKYKATCDIPAMLRTHFQKQITSVVLWETPQLLCVTKWSSQATTKAYLVF